MASSSLATAFPEFEKRSRAVLVADVVGYSRLMEADELRTHARLSALRVGAAAGSFLGAEALGVEAERLGVSAAAFGADGT